MSCARCDSPLVDGGMCGVCVESVQLHEQVTVLKAERDEAVRTRDEVHDALMNLLARIHRDGGHYVEQHGVAKAVEDAHDLIVQSHVIHDRDRGELNRDDLH